MNARHDNGTYCTRDCYIKSEEGHFYVVNKPCVIERFDSRYLDATEKLSLVTKRTARDFFGADSKTMDTHPTGRLDWDSVCDIYCRLNP